MTTISIIIPFYNSEPYISRCIESLLAQTYPLQNCEIIFVDNNSTDRSAEIVRRYPEITLITESKQGSYAARNRGIAQAKGDIIALTDPDCVCVPHWLDSIVTAMQVPEVGLLLGSRRYASDSVYLTLLAAYETEKTRFVTSQGIKELYYGYTNNMAVRRTVFDRIGVFPERVRGGDTIFVRKAVEAFGSQLVRYCLGMEVRHLEVTDLRDYYQKHAIYGQSNERIGQIISFRPLLNRERWKVFAQTIRSHHFSVWKSLVLISMLLPGALYYEWGRWRGRIRNTPKR
jgi:glycosyltransferase involved in cell wall biosynthesis